jgi:Putative Zn-dependent protease, contains TPR repeats
VHITRGALGLIRSEAELAGVLAHEIGHVAHKHTVNAIRKNKTVQLGTSESLSNRAPFVDKLANKAYEMVLENKFDRGDEMDADKVSVTLTEKAGYSPGTLAAFLTRLDERNKDQPAQNGLFASHPETKERIDAIRSSPVRRPARRSRRATRRTSSTSRRRSPRSPPSRMARRVSRDRPSPRTTNPPTRTRTRKRIHPRRDSVSAR